MTTSGTTISPRLLPVTRRQRSTSARSIVSLAAKGLCCGLLAAGLAPQRAGAAGDAAQLSNPSRTWPATERAPVPYAGAAQPVATQGAKRANFALEPASREARHVADWVVDSGDSIGMPFAIVDKIEAKVFVFDASGRLRGAAAALLGMARGDDAVFGIGNRALSSIRPEERTTPAGRFVASLDRNLRGNEILWVDYEGAVSMHRVITSNPKERRAERLATVTPLDNRISYGCINVPAKFFDNVVRPAFSGTNGIVYVLPETKSAREVFASYDVEEHARLRGAGQAAPAPQSHWSSNTVPSIPGATR